MLSTLYFGWCAPVGIAWRNLKMMAATEGGLFMEEFD